MEFATYGRFAKTNVFTFHARVDLYLESQNHSLIRIKCTLYPHITSNALCVTSTTPKHEPDLAALQMQWWRTPASHEMFGRTLLNTRFAAHVSQAHRNDWREPELESLSISICQLVLSRLSVTVYCSQWHRHAVRFHKFVPSCKACARFTNPLAIKRRSAINERRQSFDHFAR